MRAFPVTSRTTHSNRRSTPPAPTRPPPRSRRPLGCAGAPSRRPLGTGTPRPCARSCATPPGTACCPSCASSLTAAASPPTGRGRCPRPRSSGCSARDVALRDKTLWRLLYETAARANEALCLNVEDLDVPNRRAAIRGKNGEIDYLHWQTASGHLLSRLIAGRSAGPVFLTDRRASLSRAPATVDLCRETGRARLSYRRAQELF